MDELLALAPPPAVVGQPPAWSLLGDPVPADLRVVVDRYGAGCFDGFLWLHSPGHPNRNLELGQRNAIARWARHVLGETEPHPPGAMLAWGSTDNGDTCWVVPADGSVVVTDARAPLWHVHAGGVASFLAAFLRGEPNEVLGDGTRPTAPRFRAHAV